MVSLGLPSQFEEHAALLSADSALICLVPPEGWDTPELQDLLHRLRLGQSRPVRRLPAAMEVVRAVHQVHRLRTRADSMLTSDEATEVEVHCVNIIEQALQMGASDFHIEVRENRTDVFLRVDGFRVQTMTLSRETGEALAGVLYDVYADSSTKGIKWRPDQPMDTAIDYTSRGGRRIQIRFASSPMFPSGCFQVVCRLLVMSGSHSVGLDQVGYRAPQVHRIRQMLIGAQGLVLLVGPTNSGKSTSMQSKLRQILQDRGQGIKVETIEDPVEFLIEGAVQMPVSNRTSFQQLLVSTLRHDPDVLMVGEIRDVTSAGAVKDIVLAGRKVLATLHVYEALACFARLIEIGVPPDVIYMPGFVSGIVYQRLVPKVCPHCALGFDDVVQGRSGVRIEEHLRQRILASAWGRDCGSVRFRNPQGCEHCRDRIPGYKGRTVCAEVLQPDVPLLYALRSGEHEKARALWESQADLNEGGLGVSAMAHAVSLMLAGQCDPRDIETQVGILGRLKQGTPPPANLPQEAGLVPELAAGVTAQRRAPRKARPSSVAEPVGTASSPSLPTEASS
jgi:type II secretory ATPase GspE/PulE/Tfp pilus assembly ATPase PilB-like protein